MNFLILLILLTFEEKSEPFEYVRYYKSGPAYLITFNVNDNKLITGDALSMVSFVDCSTDKFRCLKIGDEHWFAPKDVNNFGEFNSPFGKYILNEGSEKLPFNIKVKYQVITLYPNSKSPLTFLFNSDKGIIAIIDDDDNWLTNIVWLKGNCGLLSHNSCQ